MNDITGDDLFVCAVKDENGGSLAICAVAGGDLVVWAVIGVVGGSGLVFCITTGISCDCLLEPIIISTDITDSGRGGISEGTIY